VMASFKAEADGGVSLWIVNDRLAALSDTVVWGQGTFDGQALHEEALDVTVPANRARQILHIPPSALSGDDPARRYLYVRSACGLFPDNRHFFVAIKDLSRPAANLQVEKAAADGGVKVRVTSDRYAYFVKLTVPVDGTRFSDNYFDLTPGQVKGVRVWNALGQRLTPDDVTVSALPPV